MEAAAVKRIRQITLYRRESAAVKLFQVDLCEAGPDRYLVNFRHGPQGGVLAEGTKTTVSTTADRAEQLFADLVAAKRSEGFADELPPTAAADDDLVTAELLEETASHEAIAREQAVLTRLAEGHASSGNWPLSRAVWRAGEMQLRAAEPHLIKLFGSGEKMLDYSICWALAQCGSERSREVLRQAIANDKSDPMVRRVAQQAMRNLLNEAELADYRRFQAESLSEPFAQLVANGPVEQLHMAVTRHLANAEAGDFVLLFQLYDVDNEHARGALLALLDTIPFEPNYFRQVRHLFKTAEIRRDGAVFGRLAKRFDATSGTWSYNTAYYRWYQKQPRPSLGESPKQVYSRETRRYLRNRSWRTLCRLGELVQPDYCRMAAELLLCYSDDDAQPPQQAVRYDWSNYNWRERRGLQTITTHRDAFARYWAFNQILYRHSRRYQPDRGGNTFVCVGDYSPGGPSPIGREEAFPRLWEQQPALLLRLLLESRCGPVHEFAAKALAACRDFCRDISLDVLLQLLGSPYDPTTNLAFELAVDRYDAANPDRRLVSAFANCALERARAQARQWIEAQPALFFNESEFAAALLCSLHADMRAFARETLRGVSLDAATQEALVGRLFAALHAFGADDGPRASDVAAVLIEAFGERLKNISGEVIRDLLAHPLPEVQALAGELVLAHETFAKQPPADVLAALLGAGSPPVRAIGVRIVEQLPDEVLKQDLELLVALTRHAEPDLRELSRPIVARLAQGDEDFTRRMVLRLTELLLIPGAPDGVPSHTSKVIQEDLRPGLSALDLPTIWKLLKSRSTPAQEVGGVALGRNVSAADLSVKELVTLADHQVLAVREAAWRMCEESVDKFRQGMVEGVRLLDVRPDDSRQFAFDYFRKHFLGGELSVDVLVGICDSVRPDVQQFGRELIVRRFDAEHGPEYLEKLSEHPAVDMQMFASSFIEQFASGDLDRLRQLEPFLRCVLTRVNRGRVARQRVLRFLESEALRDEATARFVAELLAWQSATCAVGAKSAAIATMANIRDRYPEIELPISVHPVEVRGGV